MVAVVLCLSQVHVLNWIDCIVMVQKVGESLRGEMTVVEPHQKLVHFSLIETLAETMRISSAKVRHSALVVDGNFNCVQNK